MNSVVPQGTHPAAERALQPERRVRWHHWQRHNSARRPGRHKAVASGAALLQVAICGGLSGHGAAGTRGRVPTVTVTRRPGVLVRDVGDPHRPHPRAWARASLRGQKPSTHHSWQTAVGHPGFPEADVWGEVPTVGGRVQAGSGTASSKPPCPAPASLLPSGPGRCVTWGRGAAP